MSRMMIFKPVAAAAMAIALIGANGNWNTTVERTESGHVIGNPEADTTLIEFVSYTCPHCSTFAHEGDAALQLAYVGPGKLRLEIRPVMLNMIDVAATTATNCAAPAKFQRSHTAMMLSQSKWLETARGANAAQQQRWNSGTIPARLKAVASDLGFYQLMEKQGITRSALDQCFNNTVKVQSLVDASQASFTEFPELRGTPSFALNGTLLAGTHSWAALQPQLDAQF